MTESIGIKLTELCSGILPFYLSEAESERYPYATYEQTIQEFRTKEGVYKIIADSFIRVYSDDSDQALQKAAAVREVLDAGSDSTYVIRFQTENITCVDNVWTVELQYYVKQSK